jgi:hypothetical protein
LTSGESQSSLRTSRPARARRRVRLALGASGITLATGVPARHRRRDVGLDRAAAVELTRA